MTKAEEVKARSRGVSRDTSTRAISRRFDVLMELDRAARALRMKSRRTYQYLAEHSSRTPRRVKPVVFNGQGLSEEFRGKSWADIRAEIYKSCGA